MPQVLTGGRSDNALGDTSAIELGTLHQDRAKRIDPVLYPGPVDATVWRERRFAQVRWNFLSENPVAHSDQSIARGQCLQTRKAEDSQWSGQQAIHHPPLLL